MDNNTLFNMQKKFKENFSERQDAQKSFKNATDLTAFAKENMTQTKERLREQEEFVEKKIFDGELKKQAEAEDFDFTHNYVYQDAEESVEALNKSVSEKIGGFREANIEEHGSLEKEKPLGVSVNKPPKAAGWKQRKSEKSILSTYQKFNPRADISTVREFKTLDKYNEIRSKFIETDENGQFKNQMFREAEQNFAWMNKPDEFVKDNSQKVTPGGKYFLRYGIMPFLKTYKKGWFGRKYTLDGKRIYEKKGEMTYDEYNANFIRIMSLDTRFEKNDENRDDKKIQDNRKIKGEFIMGLAKELMDQKITENMLTDEYLAEHVGEVQQYVDKLNAFRVIIQENRWVFNTSGKKSKVVDDEYLDCLIENRIFQVSDRLNVFMDEHYAAHGMYRTGKFKFKKLGMMKKGEEPKLRSANSMTREKRNLIRRNKGNNQKNSLEASEELQDFQKEIENKSEYRYGQILNTAKPIVVAGSDGELDDENERNDYLSRSKELNDNLDQNIHKAFAGLQDAYDDATQFADRLLDEIISDTLKGYSEKIRNETDESVLGIKTFIERCPEMSLMFGPEIEQLYTKLYTSKRLSAELRARKEAIKEELRKDAGREKSIFSYKTKNIYGEALNDYFSEDIKKHAREAGGIIDRKLQVLEENNSVIEKAIRFFLEDPGKTTYTGDDLKQIRGYLEKEGLGRMFKITKIDNYKELMDELILEKDLSMREKDSGAPEYDDIKKADEMTAGERALQIYNVRRRDKARLNLEQWMESAKDNYTKEQAEHASMVPFAVKFDVTQVDYKGEIPVNDEKTVETVYDQHQMELAAKRLKNNRTQYSKLSDYEAMLSRYRYAYPLVKDIEIDNWKVFKYMAKTRAKVDFLAAHSEVNEALLKIRQNPSYPYFDMSRIAGLPMDELRDLIRKLEAKEEKLSRDFDTLDKKHTIANDIIKLQDKLEGTKDIILMTKEYLKIRQFENKYPVSSKEAIDNQARKYELELRIEDARTFFRSADERYVELQDIYKENKELLSASANWSGKFNRRIKTKEDVRDSEMEDTLTNRCTELLDIDVKDTIERLRNLSDENKRISPDDVVELGKRWGVIDSLAKLFNKINNPDEQKVSEADKKLIVIMNKPKQKKLRDGVLKKLPLLIDLRDAIKDYMASYKLRPSGMDTADDWGEESTLTDEQIEAARFQYRQSSKKLLEKCEKESKDYEPDLVEGKLKSAKDRVFEELLKKGEKLSILELDKWKKKIEGIVKFSDLFDSLSEKEYWHKLAAMQILDNWPYEFEQFYALRIKNDTYRAFSVQIKTLLGKEGANILTEEQIKRSVDLSQFVSEQESRTYFVLNENDTKELDRALAANKYDKKAFKHIFDPVDVNSSGMPVGITEVNKRNYNAILAKNARAYFALKPEEKRDAMKPMRKDSALSSKEIEKRAHDREVFEEFARNLQDRIIMPLVNDIHLTDMKESMLKEEYIGAHFKELYELSQKIACLENIYRNNKEYFTSEGLLSGMNDYDRVKKIIDENFGIRNNQMIVRFKQLIDAYARKNFVDESGSFDIGLSAEDLVLSEDKKQNKEDVGKRNEKVREAVKKRNAEYEKRYSDVDAELSRNKIAKNTEEAASRDDVIYSVKITSTDDKLFAAGFHVSDFKLLVQNKALMKDIAERDEAKKIYFDALKMRDKFADDIKKLEQNGEKVSDQLKLDYKRAKDKVEEYYGSWYQKLQKVAGHNDMAEDFYKIYQNCHDENGKLILKQEGKDGSRINRMGEYIRFQVYVGADMSGFFDNFIEMYEKNGEKILDRNFIAGQMKQDNWGQFYRDIKRFSVYSAIMQKEAENKDKEGKIKGFFTKIFSMDNPVVRTLKTETEDFESGLKDAKKSQINLNKQYSVQMKNFSDLVTGSQTEKDPQKKEILDQDIIKLQGDLLVLQNQIEIVTAKISTLEKQIADYKAAAGNIQKLSQKDQKFVKKYQEYVRQVELVLTRYGVRDDGSLFASGLDDDNMDLAHTNAYKAQEAIEASKT